MNKTIASVGLVIVIVACVGFMVYYSMGKKGGAAKPGQAQEQDMYCLSCDKAYKASLKPEEFMPLQMGGVNAPKKHTCPTCSKAEGVTAIKCASCGQLVANPGMQSMMMMMQSGGGGGKPGVGKAPACPKCKGPVMKPESSGPQPTPK